METKKIKLVVMDYSMSPGPRYSSQGDDSGEDFYHQKLNEAFYKAISKNIVLEVNLDGSDGYASSFLDEAFGNLIYDFSLNLVKGNLKIISDEEPEWIEMLEGETFIEWEDRRVKNDAPKKTNTHEPWHRNENGKITAKVWIQPQ
jgi:hypothetical protein